MNVKYKNWIFKDVMERAKKFIETDGHAATVFFGYSDKNMVMAPGLYEDEDAKIAFLNVLKIIFAAFEVDFYVMVSEAWVVETESPEALKGVPPSEHPDRKEILQCLLVSREEVRMKVFPILRDSNNKPSLGPAKPDFVGVGGRMTELLAPTKLQIPEELRAEAFKILEKLGFNVEKIEPPTLH